MSATNAPYGLRPINTQQGRATIHAYPGGIASAYNTSIYKGSPVVLLTGGVINIGAAAADVLGVFAGVEYTDASGRRIMQPNWPANAVATNVIAYVYDDPDTIFEVQANGSLALTSRGDQADFAAVGTGNDTTGLSTATISTTLAGAGVQAQLRILDLAPYTDNAFGDAFTQVRVQIARHQYRSNKVAI